MKILLVNDDGIEAEGIWALARALSPTHEVVIVAPDGQRSGASHSVTLHGALHYRSYDNPLCAAYTLDGTPCDCVKFGLLVLAQGADCVISGINDCANIGTDVLYSGTVHAAVEAGICGLPAVAVSVKVKHNDFRYPASFVADNLQALVALCHEDLVVSVNMHSSLKKDLKGVRVASCGTRRFDDYYVSEEDGYHLYGDPRNEGNAADSDVVQYYEDYITVTPVRFDMSDADAMRNWQAAVRRLCW